MSTTVTIFDAPSYVTVESLKATLELSGTTFADEDLAPAIQSASRAIDTLLDRKFYMEDTSNDQVRYYTPLRPSSVDLDDVMHVTEIASDYGWTGNYSHVWDTSVTGNMLLEPLNAPLEGRPWERATVRYRPGASFPTLFLPTHLASVRVTGRFGWTQPPPQIVTFATVLATKFFRRTREAPFGIVTVGIDTASAMRLAKTDPDFALLAQKFDRTPVAA